MKLRYNFIINEIAGQFVAVPVGDSMTEFNGMIKLNDTAAFIFKQLMEEISIDELVSKTAKEYCCDVADAEKNVKEIIAGLQKQNLLTE